MKKLLTITTLITLAVICSGVYYFQDTGKWVADECAVCGKTIFHWTDYSYRFDNSYYTLTMDVPYCDGEKATEFKFIYQPTYICGECQKKYNQEYQELMSSTFDRWLKAKQHENITLCKQHEKERRKKEIEGLKKEIQEAQKKIQYYENLK